MRRPIHRSNGAILVMALLLLVILLGVAALVLDLGRLFVLKTEMQNAADAAALAAAKELNGATHAQLRAASAVKGLLEHDSHFARIRELLGTDAEIQIDYYCSIGGQNDSPGMCTGTVEGNKIIADEGDDANTHYIKVTLNPDPENQPDQDRYGIELYFLPVLSFFTGETDHIAETNAEALAGRHFYICNYPPMMLCDPFEGSGGMRTNVSAGQQILLKAQGGSTWAPGNFAFLDPDLESGGGAPDVAIYLADQQGLGCTPPRVLTSTGGMTNKTAAALNTRFDVYDPPHPFNKADAYTSWPPAENIMNYGGSSGDALQYRDSDISETNRIGNGVWDRDLYWSNYHTVAKPSGYATMSRWDVYNWEIDNHMIPAVAQPDASHPHMGAERRRLYTAVLSCNKLGLVGSKTVPVINPDGFAKLFLTEQVAKPPNTDIYVEFLGWMQEKETDYHVEVVLYE